MDDKYYVKPGSIFVASDAIFLCCEGQLLPVTFLFKGGLCSSQALLGLLLGYGKENAIGFEKHFSKKRNLFRATPMNSSEIFHLEDEGLMIPDFASFSNKETWQIMRKYKKERGTITDIYSNGNFLELTFKRLTSIPIEGYE